MKSSSNRVTLSTVAQQVGVSTTTVSLILSNREEYVRQFHPETVAKVRQSAKSLGYRTNIFASGLPTRASPFFALVIRDIGRVDPQRWHSWVSEGDLLAGVIEAGSEKGLYPILAAIDPNADDAGVDPTERLVSGGVFGTIVRTPSPPLEKFLLQQIKKGDRILTVCPDKLSRWPSNCIAVNNIQVGEHAARLLAAAGRRKWGVVCYDQPRARESHKLRIEGFTQAAEAVGASVKTICVPSEQGRFSNGERARFRESGLDGVFGVDSTLSIEAMFAGHEAGLRAGEDFLLVGVNCSHCSGRLHPRITSIDVSWREVGRKAVEALITLTDKNQQTCDRITVNPYVVAGDTCPAPSEQ